MMALRISTPPTISLLHPCTNYTLIGKQVSVVVTFPLSVKVVACDADHKGGGCKSSTVSNMLVNISLMFVYDSSNWDTVLFNATAMLAGRSSLVGQTLTRESGPRDYLVLTAA